MLKVLHNEEIRGLIQKSGTGDASALMQLSQHPDINKLFSDPQLLKQITSINPKALLNQPNTAQ